MNAIFFLHSLFCISAVVSEAPDQSKKIKQKSPPTNRSVTVFNMKQSYLPNLKLWAGAWSLLFLN